MEDLKTSQVKERIIETLIDSGGELWEFDPADVQHLVNQLEIQENYNNMLIEKIKELEAENDLQQEHLMHNEAELIPLRKENKDLHFKNDLLEDICLKHQELTQWIEEIYDNDFKFLDNADFVEQLIDKVIKLNK